MKRDDRVYLQHVLDAISTIEIYLTGVDESAFWAQRLIQDGVTALAAGRLRVMASDSITRFAVASRHPVDIQGGNVFIGPTSPLFGNASQNVVIPASR